MREMFKDMKKTSILLLSSLNPRRFRSRDYSLSTFSSSSSPFHTTGWPGPRLIQSPAETHWFQTTPFCNLSTDAENSTQSSSKRRVKSDLVEAFESAKTTKEMISVFEEMETTEGWFDKKELGIAALKIGRKLEREGAYPEKFYPFARKARDLLPEFSLPAAMTLQLMGYFLLGVGKQPLIAFQFALSLLEHIQKQDVSADDFRVMQHSLQEEYLGDTEALRFENWDEVLKNWGVGSKSFRSEIEYSNKDIEAGNYHQVVCDLVYANLTVVTEEDSIDRALACVTMAKVQFHQGNLDYSNKWFEIARSILDKKATIFPVEVYTTYNEVLKLYHESAAVVPTPWQDRLLDLWYILRIRRELSLIYRDHMNIDDTKPLSNFAPSILLVSYDSYHSSSKTIYIPQDRVGVIIGKAGETIKYLQLKSRAKIQVQRDTDADPNSMTWHPNSMTWCVELVGTAQQVAQLINDVLAAAEAGGSGMVSRRMTGQAGSEHFEMKIPRNMVRRVIEKVESMEARTGARIQLIRLHLPQDDTSTEWTLHIHGSSGQIRLHLPQDDTSTEWTLHIHGSSGQIKHARELIDEIITIRELIDHIFDDWRSVRNEARRRERLETLMEKVNNRGNK